jgi:hypothetical protein
MEAPSGNRRGFLLWGRSPARTIAPGRSSCAGDSTSTCLSVLTAVAARVSWPPSPARSAESSAISVSPQTQSSSRLPGHPRSSTTPGLVDRVSPRRSSDWTRASLGAWLRHIWPFGMRTRCRRPRLFAGLLAHSGPFGPFREPNCAVSNVCRVMGRAGGLFEFASVKPEPHSTYPRAFSCSMV